MRFWHHRSNSSQGREGFIIVAVMWILISLATLASIYSVYVANSAITLTASSDRIQTEAALSAAVSLTAYVLSSPAKQQRPTHGAFRFQSGRNSVDVNFTAESARIDLNAAPKTLLAGLFAALGASDRNADVFADRIIGWRTRPKPETEDNEDALYRAAGMRYSPRGAPFAHVNELWLVRDLPPALVERAMDFITLYSGKPAVNALEAAPEVIAALPGMTPGRLNAFLDQRETLPPDLVATALDGQAGISTEGSDATRLRVRVDLERGGSVASEIVILVGLDDAPVHILSWRDDIDPASVRVSNVRNIR